MTNTAIISNMGEALAKIKSACNRFPAQINYDPCDQEVLVVIPGQDNWIEYDDKAILFVGRARRAVSADELTEMVRDAIAKKDFMDEVAEDAERE